MFAKSLTVSLALAAASVQANLWISTPDELKQCEDATFVIKGAPGPVYPFVVNPKEYCGDPLRDLDAVTGDLTWKPDLPEGTLVQLEIEDETGNQAWSGVMTIAAGGDSSCVRSNSPDNSSDVTSAPSSPETTPTPTDDSGATVVGASNYTTTPEKALNSPAADSVGSATPGRLFAVSGVTVFMVLSTLALTL